MRREDIGARQESVFRWDIGPLRDGDMDIDGLAEMGETSDSVLS